MTQPGIVDVGKALVVAMNHCIPRIRLPGLLVIMMLLIGCSIPSDQQRATSDTVSTPGQDMPMSTTTFSGTISFVNLEGGFFALHTQSGQRFTLKGLKAPFRRDGLIVNITGHVDANAITFTQYGKLLIVDTVQVIDDSQAQPAKFPRI